MVQQVTSFLLPFVLLLCLWQLQEGVQACNCLARHPQQVFCQNDVVIRAKVVGRKDDPRHGLIQYNIKQTKMFKGPKKDFNAIYTASNAAACGVKLTKGTTYLLMAKRDSDGLLRITLCDFFQQWKALSDGQTSLLRHYEMSCDCTIKLCPSLPCGISSPTECLWTDFLPIKLASGEQTKNFACVKKGYGHCAWFRGAGSPTYSK
ncbi:metalloproteinase inhibitor 2-like [Syngnathus scovelli]|uniref:metalloproteinase inhibitor 2-like n=1 Tax=Syngnathus scovelli TaxID=161590 RepID=UPI00210FB68F|nr:metalloproteinase inhibitor 2-like [Syngnathus scovelli]